MSSPSTAALLESDPAVYDVQTSAAGPAGSLPLTEELLRKAPSGDLFGWTQDVGMGWKPAELDRREFLLLSTSGGVRNPDGTPAALGYHTGHWEVGLLLKAAAEELKALGCIPFAGFCTDPCDGRTQGTAGMMDSLPYRNDAAMVLRRLIRSLPTRRGVIGVATCDKGLPAMMMALAGMHDLAMRPRPRRRDAAADRRRGRGQDSDDRRPLRARPDHAGTGGGAGLQGVRLARRRLSVPRHGGHVAGRGRSARPVRCRTPPWRRPANRSGWTWPAGRRGPSPNWSDERSTYGTFSPTPALRNAMAVHAAFGGIDESAAAHPGHGLSRRAAAADRRGLDRRQPADAASGGRAAERPGRPSNGARLPGRRRAGGDAAPAPARPAGRSLPDRQRRTAWAERWTGGSARNGAGGCGTCCERRMASIPMT